jgi:WD40 repeat protein
LEDEEVVKEFAGTPAWGNTVSISPNQKFIITQSDSSGSSGASVASVWDVETGDLYRTINCPDKRTLYSAAITHDGSSVVADCSGLMMIWNLESMELTASINGIMLKRIPTDNRLVALTNLDSHAGFLVADVPEIEVVDILEKTPLFKLSLDEEFYYLNITDVALSSDRKLFAMVINNLAAITWSADSSVQKYTLAEHETFCFEGGCAGFQDVAFSPYGYLLASAGYDHTVRLWDAESGRQISVPDNMADSVSSVAFSPDGRYLIAGCDDGRIYVWAIDS